MKVNRWNPLHWFYLSIFSINVLLAAIARYFPSSQQKNLIILYGHKLNGNLLAIYRELMARGWSDGSVVFLTMDPSYYSFLRKEGVASVLTSRFECVAALAKARVVVSDHGLHALALMQKASNLVFVDVWHGIPFKGFDAEDFGVQHGYEEVWTASPLIKNLYVDRFGFDREKVHATGYARTDRLINPERDTGRLRDKLQLPKNRKLILFAPTWKQDAQGRNIFPFGADENTFLDELCKTAQNHNAHVILRTHLNSPVSVKMDRRDNLAELPSSIYPDTEEVLLVSDVLICDWSSIAFDFLLLDRPAIFLDVEPPFAKGFSLGPEYRYGFVAGHMEALKGALELCLDNSTDYWTEYGEKHNEIKKTVYGEYADGKASERCVARLQQLISRDEFSQ